LIIYLIIIRISIIIVVCIKFVIVINLYNFLNSCLDNCRDRKDYEDCCCLLCRSSCCLLNNYISYIFVNLLYILIKNLYIRIYCSNNVSFRLLLFFYLASSQLLSLLIASLLSRKTLIVTSTYLKSKKFLLINFVFVFFVLVICYESRTNRYYSSRIALHKIIRKKRSINKIKIIKMT